MCPGMSITNRNIAAKVLLQNWAGRTVPTNVQGAVACFSSLPWIPLFPLFVPSYIYYYSQMVHVEGFIRPLVHYFMRAVWGTLAFILGTSRRPILARGNEGCEGLDDGL